MIGIIPTFAEEISDATTNLLNYDIQDGDSYNVVGKSSKELIIVDNESKSVKAAKFKFKCTIF